MARRLALLLRRRVLTDAVRTRNRHPYPPVPTSAHATLDGEFGSQGFGAWFRMVRRLRSIRETRVPVSPVSVAYLWGPPLVDYLRTNGAGLAAGATRVELGAARSPTHTASSTSASSRS